ncbi:MAG: MerC domain-containing protein [Planctomycetota bacterium]
MDAHPTGVCHRLGWLDSLAIGASVVCAVHCLVTPVVLVALPVIATTVWVDANFHLWMLGLVLPTSTAAVFLGCRKHQDKAVVGLCLAGLAVLTAMALYESSAHAAEVLPATSAAGQTEQATAVGGDTAGSIPAATGCPSCAGCGSAVIQEVVIGADGEPETTEASGRPIMNANAMINVFGGLLLVLAHGRNFLLCRSAKCQHV